MASLGYRELTKLLREHGCYFVREAGRTEQVSEAEQQMIAWLVWNRDQAFNEARKLAALMKLGEAAVEQERSVAFGLAVDAIRSGDYRLPAPWWVAQSTADHSPCLTIVTGE
jgi:prophage antirepressor-like protein